MPTRLIPYFFRAWSWKLSASASLAGFLAIAYFPTVAYIYDYHDSFHYYDYTDHGTCSANPVYAYHFLFGRPLYAALHCYGVAGIMGGIWNAGWIRLGAVLMLVVAAMLLYTYLKHGGLNANAAMFVGATAVMLPGVQQFASASHAAPLAVGLLFPIGAAFAFDRFMKSLDRRRQILSLWWMTLAVTLLTLSSLTYQSLSETFLALIFVRCLTFSRDQTARLLPFLSWALAVFVLHVAAYLAFHYLVDLRYVAVHINPPLGNILEGSRSISVSADIADRGPVLWSRAARASTLWFYGAPPLVGAAVLFLGASLYVAGLFRVAREEFVSSWTVCGKALLPIALLGAFVLLSNGTALVLAADPEGLLNLFRVMIGFQWVLLFFGAWALSQAQWQTPRFIYTAAYWVMTAAVAAFVHGHLYYNMVSPNAAELQRVVDGLDKLKGASIGNLCVITPPLEALGYLRDFNVIDEFGRTSMMYPDDVPSVIFAAAERLSIPRSEVSRVSVTPNAAAVAMENCDNVLDMRRP